MVKLLCLKKMLLASVVLFIFNSSIAGQKFNSYKDKYTGKEIQSTNFENIYTRINPRSGSDKVDFSIYKIQDSLFLCLSVRLGGYRSLTIPEGSKLLLKPIQSESVVLSCLVDSESSISEVAGTTSIIQLYYLTDQDIEKLRKVDIEALRVEHASGNLDFELKDKKAGLIKKVLTN